MAIAAETIGVVTRSGSARIIEYAYQYARANQRKKVTTVHKANILKYTGSLFLEVSRQVGAKYPDIKTEDKIIDNMAMQMVVDPHQFDVIVTTNLFGDILSDLFSGLVGGLGLAPGANIGYDTAIFEAVHGSGPNIAGKNLAKSRIRGHHRDDGGDYQRIGESVNRTRTSPSPELHQQGMGAGEFLRG